MTDAFWTVFGVGCVWSTFVIVVVGAVADWRRSRGPEYTTAELGIGRRIVNEWSESEGRGLALSILIAKALGAARKGYRR